MRQLSLAPPPALRDRSRGAAAAAFAFALCLAPAAARAGDAPDSGAHASGRPDLSGVWVLDQDLTRKSLESSRRSQGGPGGRGGGGMGRGGGHGGGWGGGGRGGDWGGRGGGGDGDEPRGDPDGDFGGSPGGGGGDRGDRGEAMRAREQALQRIEIRQSDTALTVKLGDGSEQSFVTDGKAHDVDTPRGKAQVKAKWSQDGRLEVKTQADRRKHTESYLVTDDHKLLTVTVEMDGPRGAMTFRRYYRPEPPPQSGPAPPPPAQPPPAGD